LEERVVGHEKAMAATTRVAERLQSLLAWFKAQHITWSPDIELKAGAKGCAGAAYGVFASNDVEEGALLCTIPKAAVLSVRNTGIADVLAEQKIRGGLGLILGVMYELGLGEKSPW
jgi:hypothetical protein